jgi:hypothetical protein
LISFPFNDKVYAKQKKVQKWQYAIKSGKKQMSSKPINIQNFYFAKRMA